jgi:hypothetical protein
MNVSSIVSRRSVLAASICLIFVIALYGVPASYYPEGMLSPTRIHFSPQEPIVQGPCNPFQMPGFINDKDDWVPMDATCPPFSKSNIASLLPHLKNKRYYFYGDSVLRNAVSDFCEQTLGIKEGVETLPDPPGYLTTSDRQAIHSCHVQSLNFTVVSIYTFGMKEWDDTDLPFLTSHGSINHKPDTDPHIWTIEDRMGVPQPTLIEKFGGADVVFLGSGMWDLPYLQRYMTQPENNVPQTIGPPSSFLQFYSRRCRDYITMARSLHPHLSKIYFLTLHDPRSFDMKKSFGMEGYPSDNVEFSCTAEPRVRGLREASIAAVKTARSEGEVDVDILPYDLFIRAAPQEKRMRDDIHPSAYVNDILGAALVYVGKDL